MVRRDGDALGGQLLYLRLQRPGIEHHAIADNRQRAPHDAGRQQAELVGVLADDKRMAGIMPALETDDDIGSLRKPVDNLSLRSEEHTSELQSLMRISYAVFCLKKKTTGSETTNVNTKEFTMI